MPQTPKQSSVPALSVAPTRALRRLLSQLGLVFAFWLLIALASALEMSFLHSISLQKSLRFALVHWLPWAVLTPLIRWMASAHTINRDTWRRAIWLHVALCLLTIGGLGLLGYFAGPPPFLRPPPFDSPLLSPDMGESPLFVILRRATFQLPTFCAVMGAVYALGFYQRTKDRDRRELELESRLAQARLQALRMQLNPHFLFNTLNSISSLIDEDPRGAEEMIGLLSDLLRTTLKASDRQEVSLREELELLDKYLAIEKTRFGGRLQVVKQIDPAAMDAVVPILLLQPLVENAIKHGIEQRLAQGVIRISVKRVESSLHAHITDNGPGLSGAPDGKLKDGVGLANTRARLKELYAAQGALKLGAGPEGGFCAEIQIPWKTTFAKVSETAETDIEP